MPADVTPIDLFRRRVRRQRELIRRERATPPRELGRPKPPEPPRGGEPPPAA